MGETSYFAYARLPRGWVSETDVWQDRPSMQVYVPDNQPIDTGLVTAEGVTIYRTEARDPIGFRGLKR